jgi:hypothetical protein
VSTDASGRTVATHDGRKVRLGALVKSGGAGTVYRVAGDAATVAKLYHASVDLKVYARKVAAMLELRPQLPELQEGDQHIVQLAWPLASLHDGQRRFLGYLMPTVDIEATSELECVLQERQARRMGLPTGLGAKVTLAANLCAVIAELHRQRHYVVDLKPVNLRFYRRALYLAMLDCDGFSIQGRGERFEAPQYTPDYLAPEFHARGLTAAGEAQQDRFALAVVVFQLLNFGIHPFTGRPQSNQVPTDIPGRIAGRWYAHGLKGNASLLPSPASGHAAMPGELRALFDRAFDNSGGSRPSADDWSALLRGYAQRAAGKLKACARDATHQHFVGQECAACARVQVLAGAQAAAARKPAAARIVRRPFAAARGPARGRAPVPTPGSTPASTATGPTTGRIPPNVLARINQAWATRAPPPARRPANWPAPPPPLPPAPPPSTGLRDMLVLLACIAFVPLVQVVAWGVTSLTAERQFSQDRAAVAAVVTAPPQAPAAPAPGRMAIDDLREHVAVLASALREDNAFAVQRGLGAIRGQARGRSATLQANVERYRASGTPASELPAPGAIHAQGLEQQRLGWAALEAGSVLQAADHFAAALWYDSDDADAWFGYGLASRDSTVASGAIAIAILLYPDVATAQARRAQFETRALRPLQRLGGLDDATGKRREELDRVMLQASVTAERIRPQLAPGTVRMAEPFAWGKR